MLKSNKVVSATCKLKNHRKDPYLGKVGFEDLNPRLLGISKYLNKTSASHNTSVNGNCKKSLSLRTDAYDMKLLPVISGGELENSIKGTNPHSCIDSTRRQSVFFLFF
jgi:hypothetical protein